MNPTERFLAESAELEERNRREGMVVFDDRPTVRYIQALVSELDDEINQAGGFEAWRAKQRAA
ncbi:hypothetical protein FNU76_10460 [Chitinimonas arctica]|uniref:Uncharacterized protein n=1 Tax=Chitinimonas arctica TaxID=2594795 RepID=A0A516SF14_9NEIS|nr:hypothetical protein [Chitinimonas arctica]QDQ26751.1 hypothetical protein FNU76_10460 [Chitinimonas arctica]